ncbi:MAG: TrmH family RNA methyltransferase [Paludibacteraceae bacterium]|jgi:tRNA G18 (ribose-2'-O)-methylase SpoU|nr:TrmH family RNA methyltransferase [Paludibacteraceae bacterium]MBR1716369.1 TrmH family RNA methyltransferase [Paludibacteraceae bacterium]
MKKLTTAEMGRMTVEEYHHADKLPLVVVLDNVRSQHNVGAVFRTADAMRIERIVLCGICCCPPNQELHKTALGAEDTVSWTYYKETEEAVRDLLEQGYNVYAVEQAHDSFTLEEAAEQIINSKSSNRKLAVVLGHEVFGVQQSVIDICKQCIEIPQYGTKHSMNVSVTAGIVMYRLASSLRLATKR